MNILQTEYIPKYTPRILRDRIDQNSLIKNTLKASMERVEEICPRHWITDVLELSLSSNRVADISERIARGMSVTYEDREYLRQKNPELLSHADSAALMKLRLERKLSRCTTRREAQNVIDTEMQVASVASGFSKTAPRDGSVDAYRLYSAAVNEASKSLSSRKFSYEDEK